MTLPCPLPGAGPIFASITFAWSLTNGRAFPFDVHFVFFFAAGVIAFAGCVTLAVPHSLDRLPEQTDEKDALSNWGGDGESGERDSLIDGRVAESSMEVSK